MIKVTSIISQKLEAGATVFDKLANVITKHYKLVLVAWVIVLIISVPAIMQVNSVIKYENNGVSIGDYDSVKAQDIISNEFKTSVANGTLIVLLQSDNMSSAAARDYVLALQNKILNSDDETWKKYFTGMTSAYTIEEMVLDQTILALGPNMRPVEQQVNESAFLLWGVPAAHLSNWMVSHSDSEAYANTSAQLIAYLTQQGASEAEIQMTMGYYNAYASAWNASAADPVLLADPVARTNHSVNAVAPSFIASLPLPAEQQAMMTYVLMSFDLNTFSSPAAVHAFTLNMLGQAASITNMTFLQQVYDLGPTYDATAVDAFSQSIITNGTLYTYPVQVPSEYLSSMLSANNRTMLLMLSFSVTSDYTTSNGDKPLLDDVGLLREMLSQTKTETGYSLTTYVTGAAAISADMMESSEKDMQLIEPITVAIIIVLMGFLFRSVVAEFLPLGAVGVALGVSQAAVFVIGSTVAQIDSTVTTMLFSVLMGVGTDYSIFIMTRYREERIKGHTREEAVHTAVTWAGESIVTSGATVMIAFFAMSLTSFSFVQTMGLVLGMSIIIALMVALTLVPAILMWVGNVIFWPTTGERWKRFAESVIQKKREGNHGYFHNAATFAVNHAKVIIVISIVATIPATYIYVTAEQSFDFISAMGKGESIEGMNALTEDFGAGLISPTEIVITGDTYVYENGQFNIAYLNAIENLTVSISNDSMVQSVTGITRPYGQPIDYAHLDLLPAEQRAQVEAAMLKTVGSSNKTVLLTVILKEQPQSADSVSYIHDLRNMIAEEQAAQPDLASSTILVGGGTAQMYDLSTSITTQFTNIQVIVIIGIFIVLMIVLGSILLPLFAVISIAMSIGWSFALTYLVFGQLMGEPILFMIPLILFIMLMGIGMDYNVFILTRIREEVHKGKDNKTAVVDAVDWTGGIITALALIMGGAFASMMLSSNNMLMMFGFALAVAIMLDAMVVRTYIVPAAMSLMGKWAWWAPGKLQREGREHKGKKQ